MSSDTIRPVTTPPALLLDLYELTMAQVYYEQGLTGQAVFELAIRNQHPDWDYFIAAGLQSALDYIEHLRFGDDEIEHLAGFPQFDPDFLDRLREFRFSGDVWAPPEGSIVHIHEPLIQVSAPLPEAQIIETVVLNQITHPTLIASKAARMVDAADGRPVIEFGARRAQGADASLSASRAAWIAGCEGTSSVEAGRRYDIPVVGTMAHSFILAAADEAAAFDAYVARYPGATLLVDTFDTRRGVEHAIQVRVRHGPQSVAALRLDSGDLLSDARFARERLDAAGLADVRIVASGGLDEHQIGRLVAEGAPIDVFACGANLVAPSDPSALESGYKLVEYEGRPLRKSSVGKFDLAGRKQVWRSGAEDVILPADASPPAVMRDPQPLLAPMMRSGRRTRNSEDSLTVIRDRARHGRLGRQPRSVRWDESLLD